MDAARHSAPTHPARLTPGERRPRADAQDPEGWRHPARGTLAAQQRAFNTFRTEYHEERPHQFLHGRPPASRYRPSRRLYPQQLPAIDYPRHFLVKRITTAGTFRFKHRLLFIANALKQHHIGLEEVDDGIWSIYFCRVLLARLNERDYIIRD